MGKDLKNNMDKDQVATKWNIRKQKKLHKYTNKSISEGKIFFRKALKEVSKTLTEAVSELWKQRAAAIKLNEQTEETQIEQDQQEWRGTELPVNHISITGWQLASARLALRWLVSSKVFAAT